MPQPDRPGLWLGLALAGLLIAGFGALRGAPDGGTASVATGAAAGRDVNAVAWVNGVPIERQTLRAWQVAAARERGQQSQDALLQAVIDQELLYQEGVRQGLLQSDPVIRRRVIQMMAEQIGATVGEPMTEDLARFYAEHASWYTRPAQVRFAQIFVPESRVAPARVTDVFDRLGPDTDKTQFLQASRKAPDRLRAHDDDLYYAMDRLMALYGPQFSRALFALPVGQVAGPLQSSLGWHMVLLLERLPEQQRPLDQVRNIVARDWRQARQAAAVRSWLERARRRADIEIVQAPGQ